jgi:hypothetical protein
MLHTFFNLGEWIIVWLPEIILSSLNTVLTQFGKVSLISCSTSLTSGQNSQKYLHLTGNFHLRAHKGVSIL